jgi:hypothetical protein
MRMLLTGFLMLGLAACGSDSGGPSWSLEVTKVEKIAGCSPVAHLKNLGTSTTNNLEVEIVTGGKTHLAVFENVRGGATQQVDLFNMATPGKSCAEFPAEGKVTRIPNCLAGGRKVAADKCLEALKLEMTMPQALALTK